jgi:hypothetical protein
MNPLTLLTFLLLKAVSCTLLDGIGNNESYSIKRSIRTSIQHQKQQQQERRTQSLFTGTFSIVKAGQSSSATNAAVTLGTWSSGSVIDIAPFKIFSLSLIVYTTGSLSRVELDFEAPTRVDYVAPWSLRGQYGNNYIASEWMKTLGTKTIAARGYSSWGGLIAQASVSFTLTDSSLSLPCTIPQVSTT